MQINYIEAKFVIIMIIISVRFENNSRHISKTGMHKPRANLSCKMTQNTCGSSVWNILHVNIPVDRIFMWYLHFCKIL